MKRIRHIAVENVDITTLLRMLTPPQNLMKMLNMF